MANWEKTSSIQYEVNLDNEGNNFLSGTIPHQVSIPSAPERRLPFDEKANKRDCLIASACGILTGLLDSFWVGEFSLRDAQTLGRDQVNRFVIKIASTQGCKKNTLEDSIRFLEKKYANPSDRLTPEFGGGLQHHLRDFSHHVSPVGLICSILVQFNEKGYGTDTAGKMITPDIPRGALIGTTFEEKIVYGVIWWAFHLVSDMAGSSSSAGAGTGIPGPILSLLKELSALPIFQDKTVNYKDSEIAFSVWISKLFNGTAFQHTDQKDLIRFDLRTEIGVFDFGIKQAIPIILNQCLVRAFYFLNRFYYEVKNSKIRSIKELSKVNFVRVLPFNNRCVTRMITVSSGVFSAVDTIDATIQAKMKAGSDAIGFARCMLLRINFVGIANFAIALKNDAKNIFADIKEAISGEEKEYRFFEIIETQEIEIDAEMDNSAIYRYRFDELLQNVKHSRIHTNERNAFHPQERQLLFDIRTQEFDDYSQLVSYNESWIMYTLEKTILTVFDQNNIPYEVPKRIDKQRYFSFIMNEKAIRVGYVFRLRRLKRELKSTYNELKEKTDADEVRFVFALNDTSDTIKYLDLLEQRSIEEIGHYQKFATLKDFFEWHIREGEYEIFKHYVDEFNCKAKNVIAYKTVVIPNNEQVELFKKKKAEMLYGFDYEASLPSNLFEGQKIILKRNYLERGLYKALISDMDFADSFITSEWNYDINRATGVLDLTGVVAGYLKSVEQLLYAIIRLSINKNKFIRMKNGEDGEFISDNEENVNSTLGSLTHFVKANGDILDVNNFVKKYIVDQLFSWIDDERNGHLHKDNIHNQEKVDDIRNQTILLYYLILGGFTIRDNDLSKIGIIDNDRPSFVDEDELYQKIKAWATPVILYDIPENAGAVGFSIEAFKDCPWKIALQALSDSVETDYHWNWSQLFSTSYMSNNFSWENPLKWEEGLEQIIRIVERLMTEDEPASYKLQRIPKVIIGDYKVRKVFLNS